jgi:hypothetical protein
MGWWSCAALYGVVQPACGSLMPLLNLRRPSGAGAIVVESMIVGSIMGAEPLPRANGCRRRGETRVRFPPPPPLTPRNCSTHFREGRLLALSYYHRPVGGDTGRNAFRKAR